MVLKLATVGVILVSTIHTVIAAAILLLKLATAGATLVLKLAQTCHCSTGGANICHCLCYIGAPKLLSDWDSTMLLLKLAMLLVAQHCKC